MQAGYKDVIEGLEARYNSNKFVNPHDFKRTVFVEKPGLMPLVTAFAEYRRDRKKQMAIQPGHAFQIEKDNAWAP